MSRPWSVILAEAMGDRKIAHVHEATRSDPEGPIQRATISDGLNRSKPPSPRTLRVLSRVLGFDENAVRDELAMPPALGRYVGKPNSEALTPYQRDLVDAFIDQMVERPQREARRRSGSGTSEPPPDTDGSPDCHVHVAGPID